MEEEKSNINIKFDKVQELEDKIIVLEERLRVNKLNFDQIYDMCVKMKEKEFSYKKIIKILGIPIFKIEHKNLFGE
jgi:hypothetical protein